MAAPAGATRIAHATIGWDIVSDAGGGLDPCRHDSTARCRSLADTPKPGAKVEHVRLDPEL
jgi:hypothetical protein